MVESSFTSERDVLESLLDEELAFDATTANGLTNHLPMALVAKSGLGASSEELRRFATRYEVRLTPRDAIDNRLTSGTWRSAIGQVDAFEDLCEYFMSAVNDAGPEETVRRHLDALTPGICGAAFHGAIRLAYALELSSPPRIAAGLAYLAASAEPLGALSSVHEGNRTVNEVLAQISSSHVFDEHPNRRLISQEMLDVAATDDFRRAVASCQIGDNTLDDLRRAALILYATTGDFTSLHAVTGVEALTALRPYVQDVTSFDAACVTGVAAAYATVGAPPLSSLEQLIQFTEAHRANVEDVAAVGANSDDEHVSKLVYTSLRLHEATNDDLYVAVAARKAGLTSP
jgi:hypothetical protein